MALTNVDRKVIHDGNSSATVFPYSFPILSASHLTVIYTNAAGAETTLSPSQFSVTGIGGRSGGSVTYPLTGSPIATGTKLTIVRTVPYTQTTVLSNQGGYYPEVIEARLDQIYMAMQQLAEIVSRYTVSSISDPATEQSNYALIQALQADLGDFDKLTTQGDLLTRDASGYKRLARGTAGQFLGISGADVAWQSPVSAVWETGDYRISSRATTALAGWVKVDDGTIGSADSGATTRANADTADLFAHLWNTFSNSLCPVSGGRGATAAVDFAANKTITLSAMLGRALVVAGTGSGLTARALGDKTGTETHDHGGSTGVASNVTPVTGGGGNAGAAGHTHPINAASTMQPSTFITVFMKL